MPPLTISTAQFLAVLERTVRNLVRAVRRLAASVVGVFLIALQLWREDGFDGAEAFVTLLLLAPAAIVFFSRAASSSSSRCPAGCSGCRAKDRSGSPSWPGSPAKPAGARPRNAPVLLWRLRRSVGSLRDVAGIAFPSACSRPAISD